NTLMDVIRQRQPITAQSTAEEAEAQENILTEAMQRFLAVAENYPNLKASELYENLMTGVKQYEENVRLARMSYNDTVTKFNRTIRQFPDSLIAGMLHFGTRTYLETESAKTEMPNVSR
ncbi:MAG: LemA family protein, partial [Clostridia bacterium]|nr:LemA family protein [Clostridia bacterium]